jgi:predicted methyltransferase
MLRALDERVAEAGLANVEVVRAGFDDPTLPAGCCDLVFFANVYKELDDRVAYARRLAQALRPGGRIAIVDYHPGIGGFGPPEEARLPEAQVVAELAAAGFALVARHELLERQYFLVFAP